MLLKKKNTNYTETTFECQRDHLTIRGTEYRPEGDKLPIAIVCHGFMAFQDTVRQYAKALAELGYLSYCFDFCGGSVIKGKSDGKTTEMSVLTEVKDLEAVIDYARSRPYAHSSNLLLMGCSQGGFVSALTSAKHHHLIQHLILFYPAFCIPDDARKGKMMFAKFDPQNVPEILNCGPMKLGKCYVEDVIEMNPFKEIQTFSGHVLLVHGTKDRIVPLSYSKQAHQVYFSRTTGSIQFYTIENGGHGFSKKHDKEALQLLKSYIMTHRKH